MKLWIIIFLVAISIPAFGNQLTPQTTTEIQKLIKFIETSQCKFYRNGSWHESSAAAEHISKKYKYLLNKGLINSSEDFIERAATKSSISGKFYKVQFQDGEIIKCADWLKAELLRIRNKSRAL